MLSGSARTAQHSAPVVFSRSGASSAKHLSGSPTKLVSRTGHTPRGRESTALQASFFSALFAGGKSNKAVAKTPKQEANDLVTELIGIWKSRGDRMMVGANERIDDIVERLQALGVSRNSTRSSLLLGSYQVAYSPTMFIPPSAEKPAVVFSDKLESMQSYVIKELGLFPKLYKRFGKLKIRGPNSFTICANNNEQENWLGKVEASEFYAETRYNVLYLDERVLIAKSKREADSDDKLSLLIFERVLSPTKREVKMTNIVPAKPAGKPGGKTVKGVAPVKKPAPAKAASKPLTKAQQEAKRKAEREAREKAIRLERERAAAEREAREKAIRLEKERAAAEREAAEKRKVEIKKSVDGFSQRLREAQEDKREAVAELKMFERENAALLKEVSVFKKQMASIDGEIASLVNESQDVAQKQKQISQELRDCRQELSDLERKLTLI